MRKSAIAEASWLIWSSTLLFAESPDLRRSVWGSSHSRVELVKSELLRMQVWKLRTWYLEMCTDLHHQTISLFFSYVRPRWKRRHQQVWGKKSSWDKLFRVILVKKRRIRVSSPKNENLPVFYSPSNHPRCIWLSSFSRIQSELYKTFSWPLQAFQWG